MEAVFVWKGLDMSARRFKLDGGEGSGNPGHLGNPPNVGGSGDGGAGGLVAVINGKTSAEVQKQFGLNQNAIIHAKQAISKVTGGSVKEISNAQALYFIQNAKSKQNPGGADKATVIKELQKNPGSLKLNKPTPSVPEACTTAVQDIMPKDAPDKTVAQHEAVKQKAAEAKSEKQSKPAEEIKTEPENKPASKSKQEAKPKESNTQTEQAPAKPTEAEKQAMVSSINNQTAAAIQKQYGLNQNSIVHAKQAIAKQLGVKTGDITNAQALYYIQNVKGKQNPNGTEKAQVIKDLQADPASLDIKPVNGNPSTPQVQTSIPKNAPAKTPSAAPTAPAAPPQNSTLTPEAAAAIGPPGTVKMPMTQGKDLSPSDVVALRNEMGQTGDEAGEVNPWGGPSQKLYVNTSKSFNINAYLYSDGETIHSDESQWDKYGYTKTKIKQDIKKIDAGMKPLTEDVHLRRWSGAGGLNAILGMNLTDAEMPGFIQDLKDPKNAADFSKTLQGSKYTQKSYTSASTLKFHSTFGTRPIMFNMVMKKGTPAIVTNNTAEGEILGGRGLNYKFTGGFNVTKLKNGQEQLIIDVEVG